MVECCIDVSRGTAYGLCVSQVLLTFACILYSPHREIVVYTLKSPTNTTNLSVYEAHIHVQWMFACLSFLAFFFSIQTMKYNEEDLSNLDYTLEFVEQNMLWDFMFWIYSIGSHFLLFGIVLNVCDVYLLAFCTIISHYALSKGCLPRGENINITRDNLNLLFYVGAIMLIFINAQKQVLIIWICMLDYCLAAGHTWDKLATVDTIINCRLFYICSQSLLLCVYYGWE